jgi:hypothetical protein
MHGLSKALKLFVFILGIFSHPVTKFLFPGGYALLHPSQDGTGNLSRPLAFDLELEPSKTSAIFVTADVIASNDSELSESDFFELNFF